MHFLIILLLTLVSASAQTAPAITSAYDKEVAVDGRADSGTGPIAVIDISYDAETRLGSGDLSSDGTFAVYVNPALIQGHQLVAVDKNGQRSEVFVVAPSRSGPVPR